MSKIIKVDLSNYKNKNAKFIVGRDKGNQAKKEEKLDEYLLDYLNGEEIKVEFFTSSEIYGVVSSFILGMLSEIVTKIGNKEEVYKLFSFENLNSEIKKEFDEEINYILGE